MNEQLFDEFNPISAKEWKNRIQYELDGADYNETLIWESLEGIKVRPFYHRDESVPFAVDLPPSKFSIVHHVYVHDVEKSSNNARISLQKGADVIYFTLAHATIDGQKLLIPLPKEPTYFFKLQFLDQAYIENLAQWANQNQYRIHILLDPIHQLITDGNWFHSVAQDFSTLDLLLRKYTNINLAIDTKTYQNSGANLVQQVAYASNHVNEYLTRLSTIQQPIFVEVAVGANYFFEIAKLKALRILFQLIQQEYPQHTFDLKMLALPTLRNKTLYDSSVNLLRTTTECMSAILGGADFVGNIPYDSLYQKERYGSQQIARNQLLILKEESHFNAVDNPTEGTYYIEYLTKQIADKALDIFKQIERADGLITSLHQGTIQRKINESAEKEQSLFNTQKEILIGINQYINPRDTKSDQMELYPFVKQKPRKTLIAPLIERRLAETFELNRLTAEKK